jgi:PPK2 family polyphosphate:nucleotide phosphotransferase
MVDDRTQVPSAVDVSRYRVAPGTAVVLADHDAASKGDFDGDKDAGELRLEPLAARLDELQELLYAQHEHRVLLVLQGMDSSGKDGTVRKVFREVGPLGVDVANFKAPSEEELAHDYLWRIHAHSPRTGHITVFNRSHYEDVLIVRVHGLVPLERIERRYTHINDFERMLTDEGVTIVKCFLHISREEQRKRLQARVDDPHKRWKFRHGDLDERAKWDEYQQAYEIMLSRTSTEAAPWYVVPADRKWYRNLVVAQLLCDHMDALKMTWPDSEEPVDGLVVE